MAPCSERYLQKNLQPSHLYLLVHIRTVCVSFLIVDLRLRPLVNDELASLLNLVSAEPRLVLLFPGRSCYLTGRRGLATVEAVEVCGPSLL